VKLKAVRVRMFRNILDSTEVKIDSKVTSLVGKNESGKSAFLHALWRFKPARRNPKFSVPEHYPAWLEKRHRNEGKDLNQVAAVEADLEWEAADVQKFEERFGPGSVKVGASLHISRHYDNHYRWTGGYDEHQAVRNFVTNQELPASGNYLSIEKFAALDAKLAEDASANAEAPDVLKGIANARSALKTLFAEHKSFNDLAWSIVWARVPEFFYFADYSKLPYTVKIARVLKEDDLARPIHRTYLSCLPAG
jgi:AAA ATPase domain